MTFPFPLKPILVLATVFYINFLSRNIFAPLLPVIEVKYGLGHGVAGTLFLFLAFGQCAGFLASGFVSSRLNHRLTVFLSAIGMGVVMLAMAQSASVSVMYIWLLLLGVSAGLYLPSGIAILTELTNQNHWGKVIAIHELAPNLGLVTAPLLVEVLLSVVTWHDIIVIIGVSQFLIGVLFLLIGQGGIQKGKSLNPKTMQTILKEPSFWIIATVFSLAVGAADGIYAMLPLYLVHEIRFERQLANTIVGCSHIFGVILVFFSGIITDRIGARRAMVSFSITTGILTLMLGIFRGSFITPILVFLQATSIVCLFPPTLVIASLNFPAHLRSLAFSLLFAVDVLFGAGMVPSCIGHIAEVLSFSFGISLIGILLLAATPMMFYLRSDSHAHE